MVSILLGEVVSNTHSITMVDSMEEEDSPGAAFLEDFSSTLDRKLLSVELEFVCLFVLGTLISLTTGIDCRQSSRSIEMSIVYKCCFKHHQIFLKLYPSLGFSDAYDPIEIN